MRPFLAVALPVFVLGAAVVGGAPAFAAGCVPISGAEDLIATGSVVLLGEMHGTAEMPAVVGRLACRAVERGLPVAVGLEIPAAEQGRIDRFLAGDIDRAGLLAGEFWTRNYQDGRSSAAMAALLAELHRLRGLSPSLRVAALDVPEPPEARDAAMAANLAKLVDATADGFVVTLTGNLHNRLTRGTPFDAEHENMGQLFRAARPSTRVASYLLTWSSGAAWMCETAETATCGRLELTGRPGVALGVHARPDAGGDSPFSGSIEVGELHASPPAKSAAAR